MKKIVKLGVVGGAVAMLAACASVYDVDRVSMMSDQGGAFATALHKRYIERAQFEVGEGDWQSVAFFNGRAEMAAMNEIPAVQMPSERSIKVDGGAIDAAYATLAAALKTNAPQAAPDACARAQTWFEHWMEQSEEGHQADHIAMTRGEFEKAMPECKGDMMPMPMASMPDPVIIYFTHDSFDITSANMALIQKAADLVKSSGASRVVLIGHTDKSGASDYNMGLSRARVSAVANAIMEAGVDRTKVQKNSAGETSPQVDTADGVRERMNRRVEIMFEK